MLITVLAPAKMVEVNSEAVRLWLGLLSYYCLKGPAGILANLANSKFSFEISDAVLKTAILILEESRLRFLYAAAPLIAELGRTDGIQ